MVAFATQVKRRRGTTAQNDAFTGAEGEITVDTTTHEIRIHDGVTVGGHTIPTKNYGYSKVESDNLLLNKANVALDNITSVGKKVCAYMAMPSTNHIQYSDVSEIVSGYFEGSTIAVGSGYFCIRAALNAGGTIVLRNNTNSMEIKIESPVNNHVVACFLPVKKGDSVSYGLNTSPEWYVKFFYAQGEI